MDQSKTRITHKTDNTKAEAKAEIIFLEQKYDNLKKKLYQRKLLGELTEADMDEIGNLMNVIAMKYSQEGHQKIAEEWLRRVLKHIEHSPRMAIITYNNLACVYRQSNNLPLALLYIKKAQKEADLACLDAQKDNTLRVVTDCSLNLCAILSSMGEHYRALRAAKKALNLITDTPNVPKAYFDSLFPIIKFNQAVEYQRLKMLTQARECYIQAIGSRGITQALASRINQALQSLKSVKNQDNSRTLNRISIHKTILSNRQNSLNSQHVSNSGRKSLGKKRKVSEKLFAYESVKQNPNYNKVIQKMVMNGKRQRKSEVVLGEVFNS